MRDTLLRRDDCACDSRMPSEMAMRLHGGTLAVLLACCGFGWFNWPYVLFGWGAVHVVLAARDMHRWANGDD